MEHLDYLKIDNNDSPDKAIVFIHGWKGNKDSFISSISHSLKVKGYKNTEITET